MKKYTEGLVSIQTKYFHKLLPVVPDAQVQKGTYTTLTVWKKSIHVVSSVANTTDSSQKTVPNGDSQVFLFKF